MVGHFFDAKVRRVGDDDAAARRLIDRHIVGSASGAQDGPAARQRRQIPGLQDTAAAEQPDDVRLAGARDQFIACFAILI